MTYIVPGGALNSTHSRKGRGVPHIKASRPCSNSSMAQWPPNGVMLFNVNDRSQQAATAWLPDCTLDILNNGQTTTKNYDSIKYVSIVAYILPTAINRPIDYASPPRSPLSPGAQNIQSSFSQSAFTDLSCCHTCDSSASDSRQDIHSAVFVRGEGLNPHFNKSDEPPTNDLTQNGHVGHCNPL